MKFLIVQTAFPGDVILSTVLAENLHAAFPGSQIHYLVRKGNESLFQGHPFIEHVHVWDKKHRWSSLVQIIRQLRSQKYDHLFNVQRFFTSGLITVLSGARHTTGYKTNPWSLFFGRRVAHNIKGQAITKEEVQGGQELRQHARHEVDRCLDLALNILPNEGTRILRPKIYPATGRPEKENYICLAPASVWFTKQVPVRVWTALLQEIARTRSGEYMVYLLGGPADQELCDQVARNAPKEGLRGLENLAGKLSWLESAGLMKGARMNYVNDSAPLHLASAVDAPVTGLFCSTVPEFGFYPLSTRSWLVQSPQFPECKPCGIHGLKNCPQGHFACSQIDAKTTCNLLP